MWQKIKEAIKPTEDKVKNQKEIIVKLEKDLDNLNVNIVKGEEKEKEHEKKIQSVNKIGELYREYSECKNVKQRWSRIYLPKGIKGVWLKWREEW